MTLMGVIRNPRSEVIEAFLCLTAIGVVKFNNWFFGLIALPVIFLSTWDPSSSLSTSALESSLRDSFKAGAIMGCSTTERKRWTAKQGL